MDQGILAGNRKSQKKMTRIGNSTLILIAFSTAFFPRLLTYFGAPSPINFLHFLCIPVIFCLVILTTKIKDRNQINIVYEILIASIVFLLVNLVSAFINQAGFGNIFLQYVLLIEPFILLTAIMAIPLKREILGRFRKWINIFLVSNLALALIQSVLLPIGIYPRKGGTLQDNIAGVFASGSGSAGNYVSCTISFYFSLYFFYFSKDKPLWIRISIIIAALYQTYISDSKQVFLAFILGFLLLVFSKVEKPAKMLLYLTPFIIMVLLLIWGLQNPDFEFLSAYRNWTNRAYIYGPQGEAFLTKTAAFRIIPTHYDSFLNHFFGLGPGHTVTRLGGWMLKKYASLLAPIGVTIHPASSEVFQVVWDGWIAQESTIFFPLFTWAGIWGDLGIFGLVSYVYLCSVVWRRICVDDICRFMLLSTAVLGFVLTQMEEPGQVLTIACLLGLRWHEKQEELIRINAN